MPEAKTYSINASRAISENLDGETIIINLETGSYYSLNHSGTALWDAIKQNIPVDGSAPGVEHFTAFLNEEGLIAEIEMHSNAVPFISETVPGIEKYSDMQEMLLADPIHDVDTAGWPNMKDAE